jgi:predicted RNA-binding protein with PUA-like domain
MVVVDLLVLAAADSLELVDIQKVDVVDIQMVDVVVAVDIQWAAARDIRKAAAVDSRETVVDIRMVVEDMRQVVVLDTLQVGDSRPELVVADLGIRLVVVVVDSERTPEVLGQDHGFLQFQDKVVALR